MKTKIRTVHTQHFRGKQRNISMQLGELKALIEYEGDVHFEIICCHTGRMFERTRLDIKRSYTRYNVITPEGECKDVTTKTMGEYDTIITKYAVVSFNY